MSEITVESLRLALDTAVRVLLGNTEQGASAEAATGSAEGVAARLQTGGDNFALMPREQAAVLLEKFSGVLGSGPARLRFLKEGVVDIEKVVKLANEALRLAWRASSLNESPSLSRMLATSPNLTIAAAAEAMLGYGFKEGVDSLVADARKTNSDINAYWLKYVFKMAKIEGDTVEEQAAIGRAMVRLEFAGSTLSTLQKGIIEALEFGTLNEGQKTQLRHLLLSVDNAYSAVSRKKMILPAIMEGDLSKEPDEDPVAVMQTAIMLLEFLSKEARVISGYPSFADDALGVVVDILHPQFAEDARSYSERVHARVEEIDANRLVGDGAPVALRYAREKLESIATTLRALEDGILAAFRASTNDERAGLEILLNGFETEHEAAVIKLEAIGAKLDSIDTAAAQASVIFGDAAPVDEAEAAARILEATEGAVVEDVEAIAGYPLDAVGAATQTKVGAGR